MDQGRELGLTAQPIVDCHDRIAPVQPLEHGQDLFVGFVASHERAAVDGHNHGKGAVARFRQVGIQFLCRREAGVRNVQELPLDMVRVCRRRRPEHFMVWARSVSF